jgi:hypothetical protein
MIAIAVRDDLEARDFRLTVAGKTLVITPMSALTALDMEKIEQVRDDLIWLLMTRAAQGLGPPKQVAVTAPAPVQPCRGRGLRALEAAGLITVQHQPGRATVVRVLRWAT